MFTCANVLLWTHELMALPTRLTVGQHCQLPAASSAPTEQHAKRKHEEIEPDQARPSSNLSRASYNRSMGNLIHEDQIAEEAAVTKIEHIKLESEINFRTILQNICHE